MRKGASVMAGSERKYTLSDVAVLTNISTRTLRKLTNAGVIKGKVVKGKREFDFKELAETLNHPDVVSVARKRQRAAVTDGFIESDSPFAMQLVSFYLPTYDELLLHEMIDAALDYNERYSVRVCFFFKNGGLRVECFGGIEDVKKVVNEFAQKPELQDVFRSMRARAREKSSTK